MNWQQLRVVFAIGLIVLTGSACSSSRQVAREHNSELRVKNEELRVDRDSVFVEMRDTVKEVTTVTVQLGAAGDTVKVSSVTDRERVRNRDAIARQWTKTEVRVDTVYIEKRDSIEIRSRPGGQSGAGLNRTLKWLFAIVVALIGLVIAVRVRGRP